MKIVIINADDFGLCAGVNRAIIEAYKKGVLTSATLFTNMIGFKEAVDLAKQNKGLGIGIHLNLTWGKPVSKEERCSTLINFKTGCFYSLPQFLLRYFLGSINFRDVQIELEYQINKFIDNGLFPTHIDTHHHIILLPKIFNIIYSLMMKYRIYRCRLLQPSKTYFSDSLLKREVKYAMLKKRGKVDVANLHFPDYVFDIEKITLKERISQIRDGVNEIITHPGYIDEEVGEFSGRIYKREEELHQLLSEEVSDLIKRSNIKLINYGDIN
ncbi:MAG: ChbG/HpnK family deacetylase [Candidatus Omnitrophica bacterium]|nr:ChbG/HpnK family deacetylase [Candidatus Omnitrophota bacterium]